MKCQRCHGTRLVWSVYALERHFDFCHDCRVPWRAWLVESLRTRVARAEAA